MKKYLKNTNNIFNKVLSILGTKEDIMDDITSEDIRTMWDTINIHKPTLKNIAEINNQSVVTTIRGAFIGDIDKEVDNDRPISDILRLVYNNPSGIAEELIQDKDYTVTGDSYESILGKTKNITHEFNITGINDYTGGIIISIYISINSTLSPEQGVRLIIYELNRIQPPETSYNLNVIKHNEPDLWYDYEWEISGTSKEEVV